MKARLEALATDLPLMLGIDEGTMSRALVMLAELVRDEWRAIATRNLRTGAAAYAEALDALPIQSGPFSAAIVLSVKPALATMIEEGWPSTDLRTTILKAGTKSLHRTKDGSLYVNVPFRHYTPAEDARARATGKRVGGRIMGAEDPTGRLGATVHKLAQTLLVYQRGAAPAAAVRMHMPWGAGGATKIKPWHTTDLYHGMIKQAAPDVQGNTYWTFRTISQKSKRPGSWIHPGIPARHFVDQAAAYAAQIGPRFIFEAIQRATRGAQ